MKLFRKLSLTVIASALIIGSSVGTSAAAVTGKVAVDGSTALLPLTQQAAKEFKVKNPGVTITATGSSSFAGAQAVSQGRVQIGASDWNNSYTVPGFQAIPGLVAHKVAVIPIATIVNNNVINTTLTTAQLQGIFSGKITNWNQVGGKSAPIVIVNRALGSGTRVNYQAKALKGGSIVKRTTNYKEVTSSGAMFTAVSTTPNAIGYIDLAKVKTGVKALKYNGVAATNTNVINKTYPVWGYGYYMTKGTPSPTGATQAFINYVQSPTFQQGSLKTLGFIPVSSIK